MTTLTGAVEGSTFVITVSLTDEAGNAVVPKTGTWSLIDLKGNIINSRENVAISPLAASYDVVLSGDDLPAKTLRLLIQATYDSDKGADLNLRDEIAFNVTDLVGVAI